MNLLAIGPSLARTYVLISKYNFQAVVWNT